MDTAAPASFSYTTDQERLVYSVPEVAALLSLPVRSVWRWIELRELSAIRLGRRVVVSRVKLEEFIAKREGTGLPPRVTKKQALQNIDQATQ